VLINVPDFRRGIEAALPTFATDHLNLFGTGSRGVIPNDINVAVIRVLVGDEIGVLTPREELYVMPNEVAIVQKVLFNELFKYVFSND
jgi:hypothetical protein